MKSEMQYASENNDKRDNATAPQYQLAKATVHDGKYQHDCGEYPHHVHNGTPYPLALST